MKNTQRIEVARKIFLAAASLIVLFFIISPSLCAAGGKYSISGYAFNDANGNGEWNKAEENGLENWIVYIDKNNNYNRDAGEEYRNTNETGYYNISDLENGTYRVREVLHPDWTPTSVPISYEISVRNANSKEYNFGNIESPMSLINPDQVSMLFWIYLIGAAICGIVGLILFIFGAFKCGCNPIKADKGNIAKIVAGLSLILFGVYLLGNLKDMSGFGSHLGVDQLPMWALILIVVILFAGLLGIGICKPDQMESGQMRRAIAGLLVFGFIAILIFSLYDKLPVENKEIVSQYIQLVGIIIGFYFGAKITSDASGMKSEINTSKSNEAKIKIGEPTLNKTEKKLQVPVTNASQNIIQVIRIELKDSEDLIHSEKINTQYIHSGTPDIVIATDLKPETLEKITKNNYTITIRLSDGTFKEKEAKPQMDP
jgi:hypothetical protein